MPIISCLQVGFFAAFKGLIEKAVQQNENSPAVIAAHSMGCLVTAYFLNRQSAEWQAAHIASIIVMSAPFEGAVTALKGTWPRFHYAGHVCLPGLSFLGLDYKYINT